MQNRKYKIVLVCVWWCLLIPSFFQRGISSLKGKVRRQPNIGWWTDFKFPMSKKIWQQPKHLKSWNLASLVYLHDRGSQELWHCQFFSEALEWLCQPFVQGDVERYHYWFGLFYVLLLLHIPICWYYFFSLSTHESNSREVLYLPWGTRDLSSTTFESQVCVRSTLF